MMTDRLGAMTPERRQRLLEVAVREFAHKGYEAASLNRIIGTCGMSKSSFYHFIDSKDALFDAVVREASTILATKLEISTPESFSGADFWDEVHRLMQRLSDLSTPDAWYIELGKLFYLPDAPDGPDNALPALGETITRWVERVLEAGQVSGVIRTDLPSSLLISMTIGILRAMDEWSLAHMREIADRESMIGEQIDILKRLLSPAPNPQQIAPEPTTNMS